MSNQMQRSRLRVDVSDELIRATRARAGFDGVETNAVVAAALEAYLQEELETLRTKQHQRGNEAEAINTPKMKK